MFITLLRTKKRCKNCKYFEDPKQYGDPPQYDKNGNCKNPNISYVQGPGTFNEEGLTFYAFGPCVQVFKVGPEFGCIHFNIRPSILP